MKTPPAINPAEFDKNVRPVDDFSGYVNNLWITQNPIPDNESRWGAFSELRVKVEEQLKKIFEDLEKTPEESLAENAKKVRNFYRTGMDAEKLNQLKDGALSEIFALIDGVNDSASLARALGFLHRRGINVWWSLSSEPDAKQSDTVALYISQGGLGLPDRDYYVNTDERVSRLGNSMSITGRP